MMCRELPTRLGGLLALGTLALLAPASVAHASFSSTPGGLVADGPVEAIAVSGENVFLGGSFETIGPRTGDGLLFTSGLSSRDTAVPQVGGLDAYVAISIPDGAGGWYIGGRFSTVGGLPRMNLAHILANDTVDPNFHPTYEGTVNGAVETLALSGTTLYVGGQFTKIGGQERHGLAALDTATGEATSFKPELTEGEASSLAVDGNYVFACGNFREVAGQTRNGLAQFNASDGSLTPWTPGNSGEPHGMYLAPGGVLYLADEGTFSIQPEPENRFGEHRPVEHYALAVLQLAAEPAQPPTVLAFNPQFGTPGFFSEIPVTSFAQIGGTLYVGGRFVSIEHYGEVQNGQGVWEETYSEEGHDRVAAFNPANNYEVVPFEPSPNGEVSAMQASGEQLYLAGSFTEIGSVARSHLAAVNATTAALEGAGPKIDGSIDTLAAAGSSLYVGGSIGTVEGVSRHHLAEIDASTGALEEFDDGVDGAVNALAVNGSTLYVGGSFRNAVLPTEDTTRNNLAAFTTTAAGTLTSFAPEPNNRVKALAVSGSTLFAGGEFNKLNEVVHGSLVAFSTTDGSLESFGPEPNGAVDSLDVNDGRLYAAGPFSQLSGVTGTPARSEVAAFDLPGKTLDSSFVPPTFDATVDAVAANETSVYVGGDFNNIGSTYQPRLAALSAADGTLQSWNPDVSDDVSALLLDESTLYAGGIFDDAGGAERNGAVGLSTETGLATAFDPEPNGDVRALALGPKQLYLGGVFQEAGGVPQTYFATFAQASESEVERENAERGKHSSGETGGGGGEEPGSGSTALSSTPSTFITGGPTYYTSEREETFTFSSDMAGVSFRCSLDGSAPTNCTSPYKTGVLALGAHRFVVQAVASSGAVDTGGASESFVVGEAPETASTSTSKSSGSSPFAPVLAHVKVTSRIARASSRKRRKTTSAFTFSLSEAASVTITLHRVQSVKCRGKHMCTRVVAVGKITVHGAKGSDRVLFTGKIGKRLLAVGHYRATLVARSGKADSKPATVSFRVVARS